MLYLCFVEDSATHHNIKGLLLPINDTKTQMNIFLLLLMTLYILDIEAVLSSSRSRTIAQLKQQLREITQPLKYGTLAKQKDVDKIKQVVQSLQNYPRNSKYNAESLFSGKILNGRWNLLYTDAPDVLGITKIPGVTLTYVGQDVMSNKVITNIVETEGFLADTTQYVEVKATPIRQGDVCYP